MVDCGAGKHLLYGGTYKLRYLQELFIHIWYIHDMGKIIDITGKKFNMLTVVKFVGLKNKRDSLWECQCECGTFKVLTGHDIRVRVKSCGCLQRSGKVKIDMIFGRLKVIKLISVSESGHSMWECLCECGNTTIVDYGSLVNGHTLSCKCLAKELNIIRQFKHGESNENTTKEYRAWRNIKERCYRKTSRTYEYYGARGIFMHEKWKNSYLSFLEDVGRAPSKNYSIDRIDVNGNYEPGNVRWADSKTQNRNKRNNVYLSYNEETKTISEWAEITGIKYTTILARLFRKLSIEDTLTLPLMKRTKPIIT